MPQEWVDIPDWVADYYITAYVDVDEQQLVLWGYTTYEQLKGQGIYDADDRTYALPEGALIEDFAAFWVAQQLEQLGPSSFESLPALASTQADTLIQRLAQAFEPRLAIPFWQWGALLSNGRWRRQLYQQRLGIVPVNLSRWANQVFEQGWQSLESLWPQTPGLQFRTTAIDPTGIACGKNIAVYPAANSPADAVELVLMLSVAMAADDRRHIRIQLYPSDASLLPEGVMLTLELPDTGDQLQRVQAGDRDNYIQLPPFRCPANQLFRVRVQLADGRFQEDFVS